MIAIPVRLTVVFSLLAAALMLSPALPLFADCSPSPTGGNDVIVCDNTPPPAGGVEGGGGNDSITIESGVSSLILMAGDDTSLDGSGADTLTNNGAVDYIYGDSSAGNGSGADAITNNGTVVSITGDTWAQAGSGADTITNNGTANYVIGDTWHGAGSGNDIITNNGTVSSAVVGDSVADVVGTGADTITNNGTVGAIYGDTGGAGTGSGNDVITNNGVVTGDIDADGGNDVVTLGGSSSTGTVFAGNGDDDVNVTVGAGVSGWIDGGADSDDLIFGGQFSQADIDALQALIAARSAAGDTLTFNGNTYTWMNFESLHGNFTVLAPVSGGGPVIVVAGPHRWFDDGQILAFTSANGNGIDFFHGPTGRLAGTIDFAALDPNASGQVFGSNGWSVRVIALGGNQYRAEVYDAGGVRQFNDANRDGQPDSEFVFTYTR